MLKSIIDAGDQLTICAAVWNALTQNTFDILGSKSIQWAFSRRTVFIILETPFYCGECMTVLCLAISWILQKSLNSSLKNFKPLYRRRYMIFSFEPKPSTVWMLQKHHLFCSGNAPKFFVKIHQWMGEDTIFLPSMEA